MVMTCFYFSVLSQLSSLPFPQSARVGVLESEQIHGRVTLRLSRTCS